MPVIRELLTGNFLTLKLVVELPGILVDPEIGHRAAWNFG